MKKRNVIILIKIIVLLVIVFAGYFLARGLLNFHSVKIANWNLDVFGEKKSGDAELMNSYADKINDYDIIFIQEIKDKGETAFPKLCALLQNYSCMMSSRAGTTSSKEQYGVIYKDSVDLIYLKDYNPSESKKFERPPIEVALDVNGYRLTIYNIHTKPENVKTELENLEALVSDYGNIVIIGDLNADCSYYDAKRETEFDGWNWIIGNDEDTTSGSSDCAYDRIILNDDAKKEFVTYGIAKQGISTDVSDHYLVWVKLKI